MNEICPHSGWHFDTLGQEAVEAKLSEALEEAPRQDKPLLCVACNAPVTLKSARIQIGGRHEHWCTNPSGLTFHIGCFDDAPGCSHLGAKTAAHSWFPGYAWTVALCAACGVHLGWRFSGVDSRFHALILERLLST